LPPALAHGDPVAPVLIALVLLGFAALLGGRAIEKLGQPRVLGELLVGILFGNIAYWLGDPTTTVLREGDVMRTIATTALSHNISLAEAARQLLPPGPHTARLIAVLASGVGPTALSIYQFVDLLSRIAVIVLLFLVGLETSIHEMRRVGKTSTQVAVVGVVCPFLLGVLAIRWLFPQNSSAHDLFIGGILTATSVGITARIFHDIGQTHRTEAKIILGAAVIDDVLALLILALVSGLVVTGTLSPRSIVALTAKAALFLFGSVGIGLWLTPRLFRALLHVKAKNFRLVFGLGFAFVLAWLADRIGLATIVGAFAAGLILEQLFTKEMQEEHSLRDLLSPLESLIVPIFFLLMGIQVKLETFLDSKAIAVALALTVAAIAGKMAAGLAIRGKLDRLSVGIGMVPRGEVGLIFASIGKGLGVVNDTIFSAAVMMVVVTTLLAPPLLNFTLARSEAKERR
jgi:Kef-type K+ transport system membrane component KefB